MSPLTLTLVIFAIMLVGMAIRIPIAVAMFISGAIGYVMQTGWMPFANFLNSQAFARFANYDLSVIPLFILMGHFATQGGKGDWPWRPCWLVPPLVPFVALQLQRRPPLPGSPCRK
jgi:TRAP-type mannitol/chloroaromatic compound transport system permease large subunit